jgi:hypothetical protein
MFKKARRINLKQSVILLLFLVAVLAQSVFAAQGQTTRVSISSSGREGNYGSFGVSSSSDGRSMAFNPDADNLVAGDTNAQRDIFVHDRQTGETTRVSVDSSGNQGNSSSSHSSSISCDGRYVAFSSDASNLVAGDTNSRTDVFVHDYLGPNPDGTAIQKYANLTIDSDDPDTPILDVSLSGTGVVPNISVSPTSLNFGSVKVGNSSAPSVITIANNGIGDLHISGMLLWDTVNYSLDVNGGTNPCGSITPTIAPNNSCTVTVTFSPTSTGTIDGSLAISSDDPDTPTVNVLFTGMGTLPWCGCEFYPDTTIIPRGGTLRFLANVTNYTIGTWSFYYATTITLPNGNRHPVSGYLLGPMKVTLTYHESKSKYVSHFIPYTAPTGTYTYHGYVGMPGDIWDECTFEFTVVL